MQIHTRYKFGVLLVKENQTKEEEWFANSHAPDCLERFLDVIGHQVELQGYQGWAAGLDTRSGDSGMFTYTDTWRDAILTFHVSTLIPSKPMDKQHIQRKRHIGNGKLYYQFLTLIVFMSSDNYGLQILCASSSSMDGSLSTLPRLNLSSYMSLS